MTLLMFLAVAGVFVLAAAGVAIYLIVGGDKDERGDP